MNQVLISAKVDIKTLDRLKRFAKLVGMSQADLVRVGTSRLLDEIETTGQLVLSSKGRAKS